MPEPARNETGNREPGTGKAGDHDRSPFPVRRSRPLADDAYANRVRIN